MKDFSLKHEMKNFFKELFLDGKDKLFLDTIEFRKPGILDKKNNAKFRILLDCDSCMDRLYGGFFPDFQSGGQWPSLNSFYKEMIKACEYNKIELILFINGTIPDSFECKDWLYLERRKANRIHKIYERFDSSCKAPFSSFLEPPFLGDFIRYYANNSTNTKSMFSFQSSHDHPKEVLDFCRQFKVDAMFTNDLSIITLYLINQNLSDEKERIQNLKLYEATSFKLKKHLNEFSGSMYNFRAILNDFKMNTHEFLLFIILLGTKCVPSSLLSGFYKRYGGLKAFENLEKKKYFARYDLPGLNKLVKAIKEYVITLKKPIDYKLAVNQIINNDKTNEGQFTAKQLQRCIDYYLHEPIKTEKIFWFYNSGSDFQEKYVDYVCCIGSVHNMKAKNNEKKEISAKTWIESNFSLDNDLFKSYLERIRITCTNGLQTSWIYQLLKTQKFYIPITLEPLNDYNLIRSPRIFRPIREYLYSIIFSGLHFVQVPVEEITYDPKSDTKIPLQIIVYPLDKDLTMEKLWESERVCRLEKFAEAIGAEDMCKELNFLPYQRNKTLIDTHYFVPCCALRYLIHKEKLLSAKDIDAFLITFIFTYYYQYKEIQNCSYRNSRAMHLANIFMRAIEHISFANDVCGNPVNANYFRIGSYFQGIFFQLSYSHCHTNNKDFYETYLHNEDMTKLEINMEMDKLRRFVYYQLESCVEENEIVHDRMQYDVKSKMNEQNLLDQRQVTLEAKGISKTTPPVDFNNNQETTNSIFARENMERQFLEDKITPKNNNNPYKTKSMGRGILAKVDKVDQFPINHQIRPSGSNFNTFDQQWSKKYEHNNIRKKQIFTPDKQILEELRRQSSGVVKNNLSNHVILGETDEEVEKALLDEINNQSSKPSFRVDLTKLNFF